MVSRFRYIAILSALFVFFSVSGQSCVGKPTGGPADVTYTVPVLNEVSIPIPVSQMITDPAQKENFGTCSGAVDLGGIHEFSISEQTSVGWADYISSEENGGGEALFSIYCISFAESEDQLFALFTTFFAKDLIAGTTLQIIPDDVEQTFGTADVIGYWWLATERLIVNSKTVTSFDGVEGKIEILQGSEQEGALNVGHIQVLLDRPGEDTEPQE